MRTAERLANLMATFCIMSWRIFWMTMFNSSAQGMTQRLVLAPLEVELLDADTNAPLNGYAQQDSPGLFRDGVNIPVRWAGHHTLRGVQARAIKIRFHLFGQAKLYSFHFE